MGTNWTVQDAIAEYRVDRWADGLFGVTPKGTVCATVNGGCLDLKQLVDELADRGLEPPLVIRIADIVAARVHHLTGCFRKAIADLAYKGSYRGVYPIKVNQQRHLVETLLDVGQSVGLGLEVGSKPELLAGVALMEQPGAMIICNGFKDEEYVETALLARRLGQDVIIVLDRPDELILVLDVSKRLGISPKIGVRCKLASRGSGRWEKSGGDRAKFGLTASELVNVVDELAARKMLDALVLLHFHVGSQITDIGAVKRALREAARVYSELRRMGAGVRIMDVGGGLGVDYTGAKGTHSEGSRNYTNEEYARDVIYWIGETCDLHGVPHPDIVSESGRALVAHHSVLVFDVLSATERRGGFDPTELEGMEVPVVVQQLLSVYEEIGGSSPFEAYHDALHLRQEFLNLFQYGLLDLRWRGVAERIFTSLCVDLLVKMRKQDDPPEELARLEAEFADIYYANFSLFHSLPDAWAIEQVFPVMPLQRLLERPTHRAVIADLTCDSDGMLERFSGPEEAATLAVHELDGERYLMGAFLVGAYQEILGDYHNLFGDTNAVLVKMAPDGGYDLLEVSEGETVERVLGFVQYSGDDLLRRMRKRIESAVRDGNLSLRQSRGFLKTYGEGLRGYTYLEGEHEPYVERVGDDE